MADPIDGLAKPVYLETDTYKDLRQTARKVFHGEMTWGEFYDQMDGAWRHMNPNERDAVELWIDQLKRASKYYENKR
jgi:hypothetical protein